jgi:hypothetical protein
MFGKNHNKETIQIMSDAKKGAKNPMFVSQEPREQECPLKK